jgi:putative ABC transport system permease protein
MNLIDSKIILRNIRKHKLSNLSSVFVLTVGFASFMLIFFYIKYQKSFDQSWTGSDQIYRVNLYKTLPNGTISKTASNYSALGWVLDDEIPGIEYSTSLWEDKIMAFTPENYIDDPHFFWGDANFFKIFNLPFVEGDAKNPFPTVQSMVISESAARKLFGNENALGKHFKVNEGWEFIVSGVFADIPDNSHLKVDVMGTFDQLFYYMGHFDNVTSSLRPDKSTKSSLPNPSQSWLWNNPEAYTYIKLKEGASATNVISGFRNIYQKYTAHLLASQQKSEFVMQPLSAIHTGAVLDRDLAATMDNKTIGALWVVAILALLMSWIIFINFHITQSIERAKEIGMKKIVGAKSSDLSIQIVLQSVIINFVSLFFAMVVFFILRKPLSNYLGLQYLLPIDLSSMAVFIFVSLMGAILCGLYPSLVLVNRHASFLLSKNFIQRNDGFSIRRALIVFQFAASTGLLIATLVMVRQVSFMKNKDIGLSISQTAYSYTPMSMIKKEGAADKMKAFLEEVNRLPHVTGSTLTSSIPGKAINFHSSRVYPSGEPDKAGPEYGILTVESHFDQVYKPGLLAGRMFSREDNPEVKLAVINSEACRLLGFNSPASAVDNYIDVISDDFGKNKSPKYQICGVVENFHQESPRKGIEPLLIFNELRWKYDVGYISIAFDKNAGSSVFSEIKDKWSRFFPADPYNFKFTEDTYLLQMKADEKLAGLFSIYTILSVVLASIGLFGLASNNTRKRVKEIGIRKINGAQISEIVVLLNKDFAIWVVVAFAIAAPLTAFAMHIWLENFAYKINLSWWLFALAGTLSLGIAMLTVSWQSWNAACQNPVESLRNE